MASNALASGPSSSPQQGYIGASLPEPELHGGGSGGITKAPGSSPLSSFSTHYAKRQQRLEAKAQREAEAMAKRSGSSSSLPLHQHCDNEGEQPWQIGKASEESLADPIPVRTALPNEVKEFIVESFACFQSHTTVQKELAKRFGIKMDGRVLQTYDPRHRHCRIGKRLMSLYTEVRTAFIRDTAEVAIAHQAHRLRLIGDVVEKATNSKDYAAALKGLELAAKEMGGVLEGKSIVEHRGGVVHVHSNVEDARREVAMRLAQIVDGGLLTHVPDTPKEPQKSAKDGDVGGGA